MVARVPYARCRAAALLLMVCVGVGCVQRPSLNGATTRAPVPSRTDRTRSDALQLSPAEERRAEALAHYGAGVSLELTRGVEAAVPEYEKALELDPRNVSLAIKLTKIHLSRNDAEKARALLEPITRENPGAADAWFWLGVAYKDGNRNLPGAIAAWQRTLKIAPATIEASQGLMEVYLQQKQTDEALKILDRAWQQKSQNSRYWVRLGALYAAALKQAPEAHQSSHKGRVLQCFEKALALAPRDIEALFALAAAYEADGQTQKAAEMFAKILAQRPDEMAIRMKLARSEERRVGKECRSRWSPYH